MTDTQKGYLSQYVPTDYNSFDIDEDDFIYTCSLSQQSTNELKKLNALGSNMLRSSITYDPLNKEDYGERERVWYNGKYLDSNLVDAVSYTHLKSLMEDYGIEKDPGELEKEGKWNWDTFLQLARDMTDAASEQYG